MIVNSLMDVIFRMLEWVMSRLPDITWSVDTNAFQYFFSVIKAVCYLLPMGTIGTMFSIVVSIMTFRIMISLIKTVWAVLPLV